MNRYPVPSPEELASLDDAELEDLAAQWRARAGRGDKSAFGVAHALEVELRHRIHTSHLQQLPSEPAAKPRRWWQFWRS
ncbi:MAG: hypothetical protein EOP82_30650 [Variovorax sp.]|nr:MAG: hypothetical protein EOP82_30650 [Variovorax sp.]